MHLKSLTLKGFKSFASATTLNFEPGVTAVVGPNGSGKSNVVDALTWVMGEQGAKALRGGKMEDVIFAGTTKRPALGRAEVSLTIDNSDGALPIDYSEVTISRIMFRTGGSEYSINGSGCRLLDVQELLSDSGIGREMHVIVGQGQLDSILHATPEDRRGFIEEAAGVLKHRRRKEKALRKLDGLTDKLDRLQDLSTELRRQLKPLGRQAEVARRAAVIQAELRDSKLRLLADDYMTAVATLQQGTADEEALLHRRAEQESALLAQRAQEAALQSAAEAEAPELSELEDLENRLTRVSERLRGIAAVAAERLLMIGRNAPSAFTGRDPQELRAQAQEASAQHAALAAQADQHRNAAAAIGAARQSVEGDLATQRKQAADARAAMERAQAAVGAAARKESAAEAAVVARRAELQRALESAQASERALSEISGEELVPDEAAPGDDLGLLKAAFDAAQTARQEASAQTAALRTRLSGLQQRQSAERARVETLGASLAGLDANSGTAELSRSLPGVLGGVADVIRVEESARRAVTAALGALADGLVVADLGTAVSGLAALRDSGVDRAEFVVADGPVSADDGAPAGRPLSDLVESGDEAAAAVVRMLSGFVLVDDLAAAQDIVAADGRWVAVTPEGDVLGRTWARGGVRDGSTRWEMRDALEQTRAAQAQAAADVEAAQAALANALRHEKLCDERVETARSRWQDGRAEQATHDERGRQWRRRITAAQAAVASGQDRAAALERQLARNLAEHEAAVAALRQAEQQVDALAVPDTVQDAELTARLDELRRAETDARLELRTMQERAASAASAAKALAAEADDLDAKAQRQRQEQERAARAAQVATVVVELAERAGSQAVADLELVTARRRALRERVAVRNTELGALRQTIKELEADVARLTDSVHQDEVARAEQRLRVQQLAERALTDHGVDTAVLVVEYGPDVLVPPSPVPPGDEEDGATVEAPYPYDRKAQERRLRTAERSLSLLGAVNPLALEEFAALEERHAYLNEQIDDIKRTRTDLLGIIKDVDARVEQVFAEAFADTAVQFERVFERLFPGGNGRLLLTDPDDLLATGVDVEARPPGKKVKRLSLLSGGERSLTAVAFLIALFKARPSPFYVLDEVEAALDDTNLGRLIDVIDELRTSSQLIVITHQKRTMEAADALYGVSMRGDGVSHVISQRLAPAPAVVDLTDSAREDA